MSEAERESRRERLNALREAGVDPYPATVRAHERVEAIVAAHGDKDGETLESEKNKTAVSGRIMAVRSFGKLVFLNLREDGKTLQLSAK